MMYKAFQYSDEIPEPSAEAIALAASQAPHLVSVSDSYTNIVQMLCPVGGTGKPATLQEKKGALISGFKYLANHPKADFRQAANHVAENSCHKYTKVEKWMYAKK